MKRCPQCNRLEPDDALAFCRVDGAPLVADTSSENLDAGTMKLVSRSVAAEAATNRLVDENTNISNVRSTGPTTILPERTEAARTEKLVKPKGRWILLLSALAILIIVGAGYAYYIAHKASAGISSIAVMPFVNEGGNPDVEYLSDGMTETLISSLSQLPNLSVKARSSVFRYKGKDTNAQTIGKELNVQAILNGRVIQRGDQLDLNVELVDAATENVLWSHQYNRQQSDLVALQSEIARDVSGKLKSQLSRAEVAKVEKNYTSNTEAYQLYLKGKFYWNKRTGESLKQAVDSYQQAIEKDPSFALAYSGLAET